MTVADYISAGVSAATDGIGNITTDFYVVIFAVVTILLIIMGLHFVMSALQVRSADLSRPDAKGYTLKRGGDDDGA